MLSLAVSVLVHLLTASGIVVGLLALLRAVEQDWPGAFLWLGLALVIDTIDGPLARSLEVERHLPRFSGERLDLIVDYFNYTAIPAFIVVSANLVEPHLLIVAGAIILLTSLYHFCDTKSKTKDGYFVGFPAIWNVVVLYLFVFHVSRQAAFYLILLFSIATFVPFKWLHPVRVDRMRIVTLLITLIWSIAAIYAIWQNFLPNLIVQAIFAIAFVYAITVGASRNRFSKNAD